MCTTSLPPAARPCCPSLAPRAQVHVSGRLALPSGDVNLVATQLTLDREHANAITFAPPGGAPGEAAGAAAPDAAAGVDPLIDLVLTGSDLRLTIQVRGV